MSKGEAAEAARLRAFVKLIDIPSLIKSLERLGGNATNLLLLSPHELLERASGQPVSMDPLQLDIILAFLRVKGRPGRARTWTREVEAIARAGLLEGKKIRELAREIAPLTGQPEENVRVLVQNVQKSRQFKLDRQLHAESPRHIAHIRGDHTIDEVEALLHKARELLWELGQPKKGAK